MKRWLIFFFLFLHTLSVDSQEVIFNGRPVNYRIYPSAVSQTEVFITKSPSDPNILFAACNTLNFIPFFVSEGIYVTTDGGSTWHGNDTCTGEPVIFHGGDPGIAIDKNGTFILTRLGRSPFSGLYSHYSTDNGMTWSAQKAISTDDLERAAVISDGNPASAFYGRTYAAWVNFAPPFPLNFSFTDNGAQSWSAPVAVNSPANRSAGGDLALGPNGELYACWAGVTSVAPFREILAGFASSSDGGATWTVDENAFAVSGITGALPEKDNIRVNGLPDMDVDVTSGPRQGWIYIVTGQKNLSPAGSDPDVILNRSTDGGATWPAGIRVNQDPLNNGKDQYFPAIHIDRYGWVNVIFYDDRNTTSDSTGVFLARSPDGGETWMEYELSDHNFKPTPIGGLGQGYQGDNIDLTSTDSTLWPVWMDNYTGVYQIWTAPLKFSEIPAVTEFSNPLSGFRLFPNPTSGSTKYEVRSTKKGVMRIRILDLSGNVLGVADERLMISGLNRGQFDLRNFQPHDPLPPGIYFLQVTAGKFSMTSKIIYLNVK
jgi:hypothetical protein